MAADFSIKAHDVYPSIEATLSVGGVALDLTNAVSVKFIMKADVGGTVVVNAAAVFNSPRTSGMLHYDWISADTATVGLYKGEWEITWPGPRKQTVPTATYHTIEILADLDGA